MQKFAKQLLGDMPNPKSSKSVTNKPLPLRPLPEVFLIEKISTMMENKFEELSTTLNSITTRLEYNTKCITEAESRVSAAEDDVTPWSPG